MNFKKYLYLLEKHQLTHLEHLEDLVFLEGYSGAVKSLNYLEYIINDISKHSSKLSVQVKVDGCIHGDTKIITENGIKTINDYYVKDSNEKILVFDFEKNESIWSHPLKHPVLDNNKEWMEIILENGESIKLTSDHEVYTQRGWIETKDLNENDEIFEIEGFGNEYA